MMTTLCPHAPLTTQKNSHELVLWLPQSSLILRSGGCELEELLSYLPATTSCPPDGNLSWKNPCHPNQTQESHEHVQETLPQALALSSPELDYLIRHLGPGATHPCICSYEYSHSSPSARARPRPLTPRLSLFDCPMNTALLSLAEAN